MFIKPRTGIGLVLICVSPHLFAANWDLSPSVGATYSYSDNIELSQNDRKGDAITILNPKIHLTGEGSRLDFYSDYDMQIVRYRDNTQANDVLHSASVKANFKIQPDQFNIETIARYGQRPITLTSSPVPQNSLAISSNRTNTLLYSVHPKYKTRLGEKAILAADYMYEGINYDNSAIVDSRLRNSSYRLSIRSTESVYKLDWRLSHERKDFSLQKPNNNYYSKSEASLSYHITPKISFLVTGGDETNHVTNTRLGFGDTFWSAGITWTPSTRTSVTINRGKRFYGNSTSASINRKGKRSNFRLVYDESITTTSSIQAQTTLIPGYTILSVVDDFVLQKSLQANLTGNTAKTEFGLSVDKRNITYQLNLNEENYVSSNIFWKWHFTPRSTLIASVGRQTTKYLTTQQDVILDKNEFTYKRKIGKHASSYLRYTHYESQTSTNTNEYKSDFYELNFTWAFK